MQRFLALLFVIALGATACTASTTTSTTASTADDADVTSATEPTETPEATPQPEPTAEEEPTAAVPGDDPDQGTSEGGDQDERQATAMLEESSLGDDLSPSEIACVVKGLASEPDLLANAISGTDFDQLSIEDQVDTALIALDCAPEAAAAQFTDSFTDSIASSQPDMSVQLGECLVGELDADNPDRRDVLMGFVSLGEDQPVPTEVEDALVNSISTCVPGPVFAEWLIAEFADDPQMAGAIDSDCVRTAFPDETIRQFWGAMIGGGGSMDDVDPEATGPLMNALFSCMSMGQLMAEQAALDGVTISDETVACIDSELASEDLAALVQGTDPDGEARITAVLFGCLSPEEIAQLGG